MKPERKLSYDLKSPGGALRSRKLDGVEIRSVGDKARDKCIELSYDALVFDSGARAFFFIFSGKWTEVILP